jgi:hypothetical protein
MAGDGAGDVTTDVYPRPTPPEVPSVITTRKLTGRLDLSRPDDALLDAVIQRWPPGQRNARLKDLLRQALQGASRDVVAGVEALERRVAALEAGSVAVMQEGQPRAEDVPPNWRESLAAFTPEPS